MTGYTKGGGEMSFAEIGARLGISRQAASKLYQSALAKLRNRPEIMRRLRDLASELDTVRRDTGRRVPRSARKLDLAAMEGTDERLFAECME